VRNSAAVRKVAAGDKDLPHDGLSDRDLQVFKLFTAGDPFGELSGR